MWFLLLYLQISAIQGLNVTLRGSDSPCIGRLEVYNNKQWGLVCHHGWIKENGEVVCRTLGCGNHNRSDKEMTLYRGPPLPQQYLMDHVQCTSNETSLWKCPIVETHETACTNDFVAVECSGKVELRLNLNEQHDKCAGVVEFSTNDGIIGVCNDKWDESIAQRICEEIGCGDLFYIPKPGIFKVQQRKRNVKLNCLGNEIYPWQCMEWSDCKERASVICTKHKRLRLRDGSHFCSGLVEEYSVEKKAWVLHQTNERPEVICPQLNCGSTGHFTKNNGTNRLTCSDTVKLRNFTKKCFGDVSIDLNGTNYGVCFNDPALSLKMGTVVCRELGCGKVLHMQENSVLNDLTINVECLGNEMSLWHCLVNRETKQCKGTKVICSESLDVRLSDGLGRCSGRVEVQWEGSWWSIGSGRTTGSVWPTVNSDVVCQHLNCGTANKTTTELFIQGKQQQLETWKTCESSSAKLHDCFVGTFPEPPPFRQSIRKQKNIDIICTKEELMSFEGDVPCKGRVRIESFGGGTRWLVMGENNTNASNICDTMQCGPPNLPQNNTHANVTCSGSVNVSLSEKCWGTVEVCRNGTCGAICSWKTKEDSNMICGNLGCGEPIQYTFQHQINNQSVRYHSVYCSESVQNMSMCKFLPKKDSTCSIPAQVICKDSVKARLEDPRDKCAGNVSLFYAGQWIPVCQESNQEKLQTAICRQLNCGDRQQGNLNLNMLESQIKGLSGITCQDSPDSVSKCDFSKVSFKEKCPVMYLKCTDWERLLLYKKEGECSGPVYGFKKEETHLVREQGWGTKEKQKLCEYLQCGNHRTHFPHKEYEKYGDWWNKTYNCSGKENLLECESRDEPVQGQHLLNIQCDRIPPAITLSKNCTGNVLINKEHVSAFQWNDKMSENLCDYLRCGNAIKHWSVKTEIQKCWHFSCTGLEASLWQCGSKEGNCDNIISVACKNGIEFGSTEKCGGKLGIKYENEWEYVCGNLSDADAKKVCEVLQCNNNQELLNEQVKAKEPKVKISCPKSYHNIVQCVNLLTTPKCSSGYAEIKCEGYIPKTENSLWKLILGLLGGMLALLILFLMIKNRKRLLLALSHYRNKNGKDINADMNEMDKVDTENEDLSEQNALFLDKDEYEDVDSLMDKSGEEDEDGRKRDSSGTEYDDIEGQANGISPSQTHHDDDLNLPLLPKRPENILDQDTYEVEKEKEEDYDDVIPIEAAANENTGTTGTQAHVDVDVDEGAGAGAGADSEAGPGAEAVLVTTEVEVHAQREQ
ncbi:scavenger receptor cysteine-rich type 1 protein M160 [Carassius auratus]|uniref:Scavenger receptor cysteine-rich type 1 protein M160 n=1 Tax=Carassius auratus TaxID=7957 RepID=A0A6P6N156_CARAU|nr:scavenger receptor cysteine-rich type 1 protein M160-like [Carassius auratus]